MRKIIFGIFAHPDDEAFGPSGTLLLETRAGAELHLVTLTAGDAGTNPDNLPDLGKVRLSEWQAAAKLIGASSTHFFGYNDGQLNNLAMIEIGDSIIKLVKSLVTDESDIEIEFMTTDLNGITGHIDHIVAARAACFAFYKLKQVDKRFTKIRLSCIPSQSMQKQNTDWLFMESGREENEIDELVDARSVQNEIIQIIRTHHSQRSDGESHIARQGDNLGMNYFIVMS